MGRKRKEVENSTSNEALKGGDNQVRHSVSLDRVSGPPEMDWSYLSPLEVKVVNNNFEYGFKNFRNLVQKDGILSLYKQKSRYEKPSEKARRKHNETMQRLLEAEVKYQKMLSGELDRERVRKEKKKEEKKALKDKKAQDLLASELMYK
jgi:ribosomal protein S21